MSGRRRRRASDNPRWEIQQRAGSVRERVRDTRGQTLYRRRRRVPLVLCARAAIRAFVLPLKLEKYMRFGARRFAITLLPLAERRFGVEREPVVTYARAACVSTAFVSGALPDAVRDGWGSGVSVRTERPRAEREDRGSFDSVRRFLQRASAPALPYRERRSDRNKLYFRAVASLLRGRRRSARARTRGQADRRVTIFYLSFSRVDYDG